jgi:hypothetical protein
MKQLRKLLTSMKNGNLFFYYIWTLYIYLRGKVELALVSDISSINKRYKLFSSSLPNVDAPVLFSEKMQWLKLNYYYELMEICADKHEVRGWLRSKGYESILNEEYRLYKNVSDINIDDLPTRFTIKASHGSGWNLIVKDKNDVNWFLWRKIMQVWLRSGIFWAGREWVYKNATPSLTCEKYLDDGSGELKDYKIHCFNGAPKYIQVNQGRGSASPIQNFYDLDWSLQHFGKDIAHNENANISPPTQLNYMLEIAEDLSSYFPYARVDFYQVDERVIFGEMTFFPAGGYPDFNPSNYDKVWGDMLTLPEEEHAGIQ